MAEPLKQALRNNLETLRSFGARLTTSGGLYDKALRAVGGAQARTAAPAARPEAAPRKQEGAARIRLEGRVAVVCGVDRLHAAGSGLWIFGAEPPW